MIARGVLMINTGRDGYTVNQCERTLTVGELMEILSEYDEDTEIYLRNDDGYTYGYIDEYRIVPMDVDERGNEMEF